MCLETCEHWRQGLILKDISIFMSLKYKRHDGVSPYIIMYYRLLTVQCDQILSFNTKLSKYTHTLL